MRIAVVGARGQLGAAIVHEFTARHAVSAFDHAALDINRPGDVARAMAAVAPEVIVNCASDNRVDAAENHPVDSLETNAFAVRTLARAAAAHGAVLVHFGTDFVFDGTGARPYTEDDRPNPRSVYGTSKMLGEWFAAGAPQWYVLRVASLFGRAPDGAPEKGSLATIVKELRSGGPARVFEDRTLSPTSVRDVARATQQILELKVPSGIYHCVNTGSCTWQEAGVEAARLLGVPANLQVMRLADAKLRAERPIYSALSNAKLTSLGISMPTWQEALARDL